MSKDSRINKLVSFNEERIGTIQEIISELRGELQVLYQTGHGCVCDQTGTCAGDAGAANAINDAIKSLKEACNTYHASSREYRR